MLTHKQFFDTIQSGDLEATRAAIVEQPGMCDARTDQGVSAVRVALYSGHPAIAHDLIASGARLDLFDACAAGDHSRVTELLTENPEAAGDFSPDGFTPLTLASYFGHPEIVNQLLEKGSGVNVAARNPLRAAPLHSAIAARHGEIARTLIQRGADVNARQQGEFTPLHGAAASGDRATAELLLQYGADPNPVSATGETPVALAAASKHPSIVDLLTPVIRPLA